MAQVVMKSKLNCDGFKKCGEISALLSEDQQQFYLNCGFCDFTYLQLNHFIQHICDEHRFEFSKDFKQGNTNSPPWPQESLEYYDLNPENGEFSELNPESNKLCEADPIIEEDIKEESSQHSYDEDDMVGKHTKTAERHDEVDGTNEAEQMSDTEDYHNEKETIVQRKNTQDSAGEKEVLKTTSNTKKKKSKPTAKDVKILETVLDVGQCIILAVTYKEYTCLWDEKDIHYRLKNRRDEALKSLHKEFNKRIGLHLTENELNREIIRLRKICTNEKRHKITCKQNKLDYKPSCSYYEYLEYLEVNVTPFECSKCGGLYSALGRLNMHMSTHDGSLPFKCHICGHGFQCGTNLTVHIRRHVRDYEFSCGVCNQKFATTTELKSHMRTHTGEKPFVCYICGVRTTTSGSLIEHKMIHEEAKPIKCDVCFRGFKSKSRLTEHKRSHSNERNHKCDICNKAFKIRRHLKQHRLIHSNVKGFVCKVCGKSFAQPGGLSGHMKSHGVISNTNEANSNPEELFST